MGIQVPVHSITRAYFLPADAALGCRGASAEGEYDLALEWLTAQVFNIGRQCGRERRVGRKWSIRSERCGAVHSVIGHRPGHASNTERLSVERKRVHVLIEDHAECVSRHAC